MLDLVQTLTEVVGPALAGVFRDDEVSSVTVSFDPEVEGGSLVMSLVARDEPFFDIVVQGSSPDQDTGYYLSRLRSNLVDFVSRVASAGERTVPTNSTRPHGDTR